MYYLQRADLREITPSLIPYESAIFIESSSRFQEETWKMLAKVM